MKKKIYRTPAIEVTKIEERLLVYVSTNTGLSDGGEGSDDPQSREDSYWDDYDE